jgi:hypothetical protein
MPGSTLTAFANHGSLPVQAPDADNYTLASAYFEELERVGIDFADVTDTLEREGLAKFEDSWAELAATVSHEMRSAADKAAHAHDSSEESSSGSADLLAIYLNDHLSGATGGVELLRRAAQAQQGQGQKQHAGLAELAKQVEQDRHSLLQIMTDLDVPTDHSKVALGWLAEKAGRLKPNGHLFSRSPLSDVLELESMLLGVQGKASCWRTLRNLAETDHRLYVDHLDTLLERAENQTVILEKMRIAAAARALGAAQHHGV